MIGGKIEHKSLQMNNEHVWHLSENLKLLQLHFLFAIVTIVLVNSLSVQSLLQTLLDTCSVLYGQSERIKSLN